MIHGPAGTTRARRKTASLWSRLIGTGGPGRHRGRRILALAAALGVPAMAAPGDWHAFGQPVPEAAPANEVKPMPFERAGHSFPGSAFYFLEDSPRVVPTAREDLAAVFDPTGTGDGTAAELAAARTAGPAARSFTGGGTGIDRSRALHCLASAVYYEAASETRGGQKAVAQVVLNRVAHPTYPNSVCGVVFQGSERKTGCQFTFTCDGSLARKPMKAAWDRALGVASEALAGEVYAPVGLATHYHTIWINPYWAPSLDTVGTIGAHRFYRWRGKAGRPAAFTASYRGSEPVAAPARRAIAETPALSAEPAALAPGGSDPVERGTARPSARAAAAPGLSAAGGEQPGDAAPAGGIMPSSGRVRPEYANSGRWIADPQ
ncbi:cell wall hydrolase [Pelagerythrobacter marensis]|uniref:Cell wall hydrolase, SleB n=1 Tax=Pelagerythrobacter marensis TaxID=543877 RepID=A0A0G3X7P0_9SPHN|nr:cell wall hydrolase [Pelagerythrobacter marensis]AKM06631.1 Cell wall hydrolase, SleB [Pelagerythrobacter marensis]